MSQLQQLRALLAKPENWIKGKLQIGDNCFCLAGATMTLRDGFAVRKALRDHLPEQFGRRIITFNDAHTTTHADILALIDKTIAASPHL